MSAKTLSEVDIWREILTSDDDAMSEAEANAVPRWPFNDRAKSRMEDLANRNGQGTRSESEREMLETYVNVGQVIAIVQAKTRLASKESDDSEFAIVNC